MGGCINYYAAVTKRLMQSKDVNDSRQRRESLKKTRKNAAFAAG
jgi:hypothetical protein